MRENEILRAWKLHIRRDGYIQIHITHIYIHPHKEIIQLEKQKEETLPCKRDFSSTCWDPKNPKAFSFFADLFI
jgi:hypothetical protein